MRRARKVDANQAEIVAALRAAGCSVEVLSDVGRGVPDLLVGHRLENYLIEVKQPGEHLTEAQVAWRYQWAGEYMIMTSPKDVEKWLGYR